MRRPCWALVSAALVLAWPAAAIAEQTSAQPLKLHVEVCDAAQVSVSRLVEVLSTELAPRSVDWVDDVTSEPTRCEVLLCYATPDGALLRVFHAGLEVSQRQVDLSDVEGDSRVRTLAAIVAETLSATEPKRTEAAETKPNPATLEQPAPPATGSVRLLSGSVQLAGTSNARTAPSWHSGAALLIREYSRAGSPFFVTAVHLGYRRFEAELSLGRSHVTALTGDITHSFVVAATSFELARFFQGPQLIPRLRFETGVSWAQSHSSDVDTAANTRAAPLSAAMLEVDLRQRVVSRTSMELKCLGGYSGGLTAAENGVARSSTSGWLASLGLGVDFDL